MMTVWLDAFGYDTYGNAPALLAPCDAAELEANTWKRADGNVVCERCKLPYRTHPRVQGALWLHRTCEDGLVKL